MEEYLALRPYLFSIAYRMLGSAMDAEDVLQDAYVRWTDADRREVRSPKAFLSTVVTRLCLNRLTSARSEREAYVGVWLPEPILTGVDGDWSTPEAELGDKESLSLGFMLLLESLSPDERAVFVLRSVYDYDYAEIAGMTGKSQAACRQLFHRARTKLSEAQSAEAMPPEAMREIAGALTSALSTGDIGSLTALLAEDVTSMADGGGKVRGAGTRPVHGLTAVTAVLRAVFRTAMELGVTVELTEVNGKLGLVGRLGGVIGSVGAFEFRDGRISRVMFVLNPDKLAHLNRR